MWEWTSSSFGRLGEIRSDLGEVGSESEFVGGGFDWGRFLPSGELFEGG